MNNFWSFVSGAAFGSVAYFCGYLMGKWAARKQIDG